MNKPDKHLQRAAERFDEWAETYGEDRISGWFQHYQQTGLGRFDFEGSEHFLDVGCGTGWAARKAASMLPRGQALGIDISPAMIQRATRLAGVLDNCEFRLANAERLPRETDSIDAILCSFSFHHYPRPLAALAEFRRVLKPGGRLVLIDSARDTSLAIWMQDRWRRYLEPGHVRYYTVAEMQTLLAQSGFVTRGDIQTERGVFRFGKVFTGLMIVSCGAPGR